MLTNMQNGLNKVNIMSKVAVITGITGNFTKMNPADPELKGNSFVYTTNTTEEFRKECEDKGWDVKYLSHLSHTDNLLKASIQSKDVKFCKFDLDDSEPLYEAYDYVLYADHKFMFSKKQVNTLLESFEDKYVCAVGEQGSNVFEEFFCATAYKRYVDSMEEMRKNIDWYIENHSWEYCHNKKKPMANMSYILWNTKHPKFKTFIKDLQEEQEKFQHPECQILFTLFMKTRPELVQLLPTHSLIGELKRNMPEDLIPHKMY